MYTRPRTIISYLIHLSTVVTVVYILQFFVCVLVRLYGIS